MNTDSSYQVLLYYKYTKIEDPELLQKQQMELCRALGLKGRIIVADEGINGTVEGLTEKTEEYIKTMTQDPRFQDIHFKKSVGTGSAFGKLFVRVRPEIVATHFGDQDIDPTQVTGKYLQAEELHEWITSGKKFYIVDMRNDYEQQSGYFENSIMSGMSNFWELPKVLERLKDLKDEIIVTICTGGVRCEKASGFLVKNGFKEVYQLYGGIVTYMEKYPNQHFKGKLYVFDNRLVMGFNTDDPEHEIVGRCMKCQIPCDSYVNCAYNFCHFHYISCDNCLNKDGLAFDKSECEEIYYDRIKDHQPDISLSA